MFGIPTRAFLLHLLVGFVGFPMGVVIASWILPTILAVTHDGLHGLGEIPVDWWGAAHAPTSFGGDPKLVDFVGLVVSVVILVPLLNYLDRLWEKIGTRLGWMTKEQAEQFRNRRQVN